jgi:hypothetical protein
MWQQLLVASYGVLVCRVQWRNVGKELYTSSKAVVCEVDEVTVCFQCSVRYEHFGFCVRRLIKTKRIICQGNRPLDGCLNVSDYSW